MDINNLANKGLSGLINLGNTCYLNSAIQCLSNTKALTKYFLSGEFKDDINVEKKEYRICIEYYKILTAIWEDSCIVKPLSFYKTFITHESKFKNFTQQDAQEALSSLLNILHTSLSSPARIHYEGEIKNDVDKMIIESIKIWEKNFKKEYSNILDLFFGQFHSRLVCKNCRSVTNNYDPFCIVTLPITSVCNNIYDCFEEFCKFELLNTNNQRECEKCKEKSDAYKSMCFLKMPKILIISFKRFNFHFFATKINRYISFPLDNLNLKKYVTGYDKVDSIYHAFAIINHIGGAESGHYFAYCKNVNGKWYEYNDENVIELHTVDLKNAYVIFYEKKEV